MIKHVVMWKLKEMDALDKEAVLNRMKEGLEQLAGRIEGLLEIQVGIDFLGTEQSYDVALISIHESKEALAAYQVHPLHQEAATHLVKPYTAARASVDFEY